jgi:glycosyltransferase involved in cell wall biosynthesis
VTPTICLNMIVKDEAPVIRRCLDSARGLIDRWVIVDTGSSDGTQDLIRNCLHDVPGELHERPWRNFGHNRSEALALARGAADYVLLLDADEELQLAPGFARPALAAAAYSLEHVHGGIAYWRPSLVAARCHWRYVGVIHEYLHSDQCRDAPVKLPGVRVLSHTDGARGRGQSVAEKYRRDARVLEHALIDEPDNERYVFYLAQSYRDSEQPQRALEHYERRAALGGWTEEIWNALHEIARLHEQLGAAPGIVLAAYLRAYQHRPQRAESLCALARYCRQRSEFALAWLFAQQAVTIPLPDDILFVDPSVYAWRCRDEYAVAAYWTGRYEDCARACRELLAGGALPAEERERVEANLKFALDRS